MPTDPTSILLLVMYKSQLPELISTYVLAAGPLPLSPHIILCQLYVENQKHIPNFWIYDAFLLDKQLSIWRIAQKLCPFL